jgi:Integrase core domain
MSLDFQKQLKGYGLTSANILYRRPDHPWHGRAFPPRQTGRGQPVDGIFRLHRSATDFTRKARPVISPTRTPTDLISGLWNVARICPFTSRTETETVGSTPSARCAGSTMSFGLLYGLLVLQHARWELLWLAVTARPSAQWIAQQLIEAYGWKEPLRYLIRDRDSAYGEAFIRRIRAMGIRDRPISARSPWQNGYVERLIGSIRRDCLDHVVVLGERHLRHLLHSYQRYYNEVRTHLSLHKDAPVPREVRAAGRVLSVPILGGLHHQYVRV